MATHVAKKMKVEHESIGSSINADAAMKPEGPNASDDGEDSEDETGTSAIAQFQSEDVSDS